MGCNPSAWRRFWFCCSLCECMWAYWRCATANPTRIRHTRSVPVTCMISQKLLFQLVMAWWAMSETLRPRITGTTTLTGVFALAWIRRRWQGSSMKMICMLWCTRIAYFLRCALIRNDYRHILPYVIYTRIIIIYGNGWKQYGLIWINDRWNWMNHSWIWNNEYNLDVCECVRVANELPNFFFYRIIVFLLVEGCILRLFLNDKTYISINTALLIEYI